MAREDRIEESVQKYVRGRFGLASRVLQKRERIPTGCLIMDHLIGGGIPIGRVTELAGTAGSGKTTMALYTIAQAQKLHPRSVQMFVDAEAGLDADDPRWEMTGIDLDRLILFYPIDYGEKTLDAMRKELARLGSYDPNTGTGVDLVVIDSIASLAPYIDIDAMDRHGLEGQTVGTHARMVSKAYRVLVGTGMLDGCATLAINQLRHSVSMTPMPPSTTGGMASTYYPKLRVWLTTSRSRRIKRADIADLEELPGMPDFSFLSKEEAVGHEVDVEVIKNNAGGLPYRKGTFRVIYGYGYDNLTATLTLAIQFGLVEQKGSVFRYGDTSERGRGGFIRQMVQSGVWSELERLVRAHLFGTRPTASLCMGGEPANQEGHSVGEHHDEPDDT